MMVKYRAGVIGCGRMGGFIDNEWVGGPLESLLPQSHAAVYEAINCIDIVACCDPREDVMAAFGERYGVPKERQYVDFRDMLSKEKLDIVSITTQPEQRAEIIIKACKANVRAIFAEKPLCASLMEADLIVETVKRNNVAFNMGTTRRWDRGFDRMKQIVKSGRLGKLNSIVLYNIGTLFNTGSHWFDLALWLNDDDEMDWIQAHVPNGEAALDGNILRRDPSGQGIIQFKNGVTVYALQSSRKSEIEVICEKGSVTSLNNGLDWIVRRQGDNRHSWETDYDTFSDLTRSSANVRLVEDLVHALDTGSPTRGGVDAAIANQEIIAGFVESHRRGGARVNFPITSRRVRLEREGMTGTSGGRNIRV